MLMTVAVRMSMELVFEFPTIEHLRREERRDGNREYDADTADDRAQNLGDEYLIVDRNAVRDRSLGIKKQEERERRADISDGECIDERAEMIEKLLHWHHHGEDADDAHVHPVGKLILISDGVHSFIDGLIIAASYFVSLEVGIATTIAVVLHEIPQEIGDFAVLIHAGYTKKRALWLNFLSALFAFAGLIISFAIAGTGTFEAYPLPITAGGFIYIALSDLIPELHKEKKGTSLARPNYFAPHRHCHDGGAPCPRIII